MSKRELTSSEPHFANRLWDVSCIITYYLAYVL